MRCGRNKCIALIMTMLLLVSCSKAKEEPVPTETPAVGEEQDGVFSDNYKSQSQLYTDARIIIETYSSGTLDNALQYIRNSGRVKDELMQNGVHKMSEGYLLDRSEIVLTGVEPVDNKKYKFFVNFNATYTDAEETGYLDKSFVMIMHYTEDTLEDIELIEGI